MSEDTNGACTTDETLIPSNVYKPSLTVDVTTDVSKEGPDVSISPQVSQTPHVSTNIFVAGIPAYWDENDLREHYKQYGEIISTRVVKNRHFGFVMFRLPDSAHVAINATHLTRPVQNSPTLLHVSIAMHDEGVDEQPNDRLFVRNLPQWATKDHLKQCFAGFGTILECAVLMNPLGQCKGSGFVQFSSLKEAAAAINGRNNIKIDNWDHPLEVKYSETAEVRRQRQERNRNRQKKLMRAPRYKGGSLPMPIDSPYFFSPAISVLPSPHAGYPLLSPVPLPLVYPQSPALSSATAPNVTSPQSTQIIYSQPIAPPNPTFYPPQNMIVLNSTPFPQKGDLYFSGASFLDDLLGMLLQPFGQIDRIDKFGQEGISIRMKDNTQHALIAQQLNGTIFATGEVLSVALYA